MSENKSKKFIYHFFSKLLVVSLSVFLLGYYIHTYAIVSPYQPGQTLDPACTPVDTNCYVQILPDQTGNSGKYLTTDGSVTSWASVAGGGLLGSTSTGGTETWLGTSSGSMGTASTDHTVFIGIDAGKNSTNATNSIFIGPLAGQSATGAYSSTFIGFHAGVNATNALQSNFLGYNAGAGSSAARDSNFFGAGAGQGATSAFGSSFLGNSAGFSAVNAANSNFFGTQAGETASSASGSNFFGYQAGRAANNALQSNFFGYQAGLTATGANDSNFLGGQAGYFATSAHHSNFIGALAGLTATGANNSNFFGYQAGYQASGAFDANFFGRLAGNQATNAFYGNFFGYQAGSGATNAVNSNFFGVQAGQGAASALNSNFFGFTAGWNAANASNSIFIGTGAGYNDAVNNTFSLDDFSILIGKDTSTGGYKNSIAIGGSAVNTASNQFVIGSTTRPIQDIYFGSGVISSAPGNYSINATSASGTNVGGGGLIFRAGRGTGDASGFSGSILFQTGVPGVSGSTLQTLATRATILTNGNFGIGNNTPSELLSLGSSFLSTRGVLSLSGETSGKVIIQPTATTGSWTLTLPTSAGSNGYVLTTNGSGVTSWTSGGGPSLIGSTSTIGTETWLGTLAGNGGASSSATVAIGYDAGDSATSATGAVFIGYVSGVSATNATYSTFVGYTAGVSATNASNSSFFGNGAGTSAANASNSSFFGAGAGSSSTYASQSNFFGASAGASSTYAYRSNFFGSGAGSSAVYASDSTFIGNSAGGNVATDSLFNCDFTGTCFKSIFIGDMAGINANYAAHSIFIGNLAGNGDIFGNGDLVDNSSDPDDYSILIGNNTSTGANKNSIALGSYATNTASNQLMIGSTTRSIEEMVITGAAQTCTIRPDTAGINCTSDERLKTNISDLASTLDLLKNIRTVNYNWSSNPNANPQIGFLAQNLKESFPTLVSTAPNGYYQVNYAGMTPILVNAIQELNLKIEGLSSLDTENTNSLGSLIKNFLGSISNSLDIVFFGEVHAKKLCLEDVCVTKDQLQLLLNNINSGGGGGPIDPPPLPTDICPNIDDVQSEIPTGYHLDETNNCIIVDVTPPPDPIPDPTPTTPDQNTGDSVPTDNTTTP